MDIPSPPGTSPLSPPPPPANPWVWRCHSCMMIYRLAVTRRCLECDHQFCLGGLAPTIKGKKRKRSRGGSCKAEFDYNGWSLYNSWRRTVMLNPSSSSSPPSKYSDDKEQQQQQQQQEEEEKEETWGIEWGSGSREPFHARRDSLFVRKRHNCWVHCDFPSECHHTIYRAQQEGRPILAAAEALDAVQAAVSAAKEDGEANKLVGGWRKKVKSESSTTVKQELEVLEETGDAYENEGDYELDLVKEYEYDEDGVSPCSPEQPTELTREPDVSPVTPTGAMTPSTKNSDRKVSSQSRKDNQPNRDLVTDAPLEFEIYSDDTHVQTQTTPTIHLVENHGPEDKLHKSSTDRHPGRRGGPKRYPRHSHQLSSFPPLVDSHRSRRGSDAGLDVEPEAEEQVPTTDELESAYSEEPWYSATTAESGETKGVPTRRSPGRRGGRNKMLALLARRNAAHSTPTTTTTGHTAADEGPKDQRRKEKQNIKAGEDWESWSDSSSSSLSSSSSSSSSYSASSSSGSGDNDLVAVVDVDGDSPMPEALSELNEDADMVPSPVTPVKGDSKDGETDFISLLKMQNAFMRGDM